MLLRGSIDATQQQYKAAVKHVLKAESISGIQKAEGRNGKCTYVNYMDIRLLDCGSM
jgi:hypothetical protein